MSRIRIRGFQSVDKLYLIWGKGYDKLKRVTLRGNKADGTVAPGYEKLEGIIDRVSVDNRSACVLFAKSYRETDVGPEDDELAELEVTVYNEADESDSETSDP